MKNVEAYKILENTDCHGLPAGNSGGIAEAIKVSKAALKKQIPAQVIYEGDGYADGSMVYDIAKCPDCNHEIEEGDLEWEAPFCSRCGKALDWYLEEK